MDTLYEWGRGLAEAGLLPEAFRFPYMVRGLLAALIVAPLLGGLSHLVVTKRLAFFSATLGNAALTGLVIGIALGEPVSRPYGGLFGFCLLVGIGMVYLQGRTRLSSDTLVGVFLALSLGLGICLLVAATRRFNIHQIEAVMFGSLVTVMGEDLLVLGAVAAVAVAVLFRFYNRFMFAALEPSLARSEGVRVTGLEYLFVAVLTISIVASLKIVGALLVGALVVIPAAAAKNLAGGLRGYLGWSVAVALAGAVGGLMVSSVFPVPSGGAIVLVLAGLFFVTVGIGWARRRVA